MYDTYYKNVLKSVIHLGTEGVYAKIKLASMHQIPKKKYIRPRF